MHRTLLLAALTLTATAALAQPNSALPLAIGGRVVTSNVEGMPRYTYQWPGVYFEAAFDGPTVDVKLDDDQNALDLTIDGVHKLTFTRPGKTTVALKNLGAGPHVVRLEKTSETQTATGAFEGFFAPAAASRPAPHHARAIEFIGDSITVGYGNLSRGQICTTEDVLETTDTSRAWAPAVAKHFDAAYRIVANSGKGIVRNYANLAPGQTIPELYPFALFDKSVPVDDNGWSPDLYVINLGTNDFSTDLKPDEPWKSRDALHADFVRTYVAFVKALHAAHPQAYILFLTADDPQYPFTAAGTGGGELYHMVSTVFAALKADGIADIDLATTGKLDYQACHGHPSLKDEKIVADQLIGRIAKLPAFAPTQTPTQTPAPAGGR